MRLQKFISSAGVCSRRRAETLIQQGRVRVNGQVVVTLGTQVDPNSDRVELDGSRVKINQQRIYIAMNKPKGVVTSCFHRGEKTILDIISIPQRVYPVGRLDKDSIGLILLTNDGRLHHRLLHPSFDHEKEYDVEVAHRIPDKALVRLARGVHLSDGLTRPAKVTRLGPKRFRIILKEGKNRQIRRMVGKVGNQVVELKRIRIATIRLGNIRPGAYRYLSRSEIHSLLISAGLKHPC